MIETTRLRLRPPVPADAAEIEAQASDWDVARATDAIPHPYPPGAAESWILQAEEERRSGEALTFAIERRADAAVVGALSLGFRQTAPIGSFGYWIGRAHWRRGYGGEAVRGVLAFAFGDLRLTAIEAATLPDNEASIALLRSAGFKETGRGEHPYRGGMTEVRHWYLSAKSFKAAS